MNDKEYIKKLETLIKDKLLPVYLKDNKLSVNDQILLTYIVEHKKNKIPILLRAGLELPADRRVAKKQN